MLYSFDVFDTLITRNTATTTGVFAGVQRALLVRDDIAVSRHVRENFFYLRIGAEQVARNTYCGSDCDDVTPEQIYGVLVKQGQITEKQAKQLQQLEEEAELATVVGIRENIERVKRLVAAGERVVLISDMYLGKEIIRRMLCRTDEIFGTLPLYVSSEIKKNKWTGRLYEWVREKEAAAYEEWIHVGDNLHSDVAVPQSLGIRCEAYRAEELLPIEKEYLRNRESDWQAQRTIGNARIARILENAETAGSANGVGSAKEAGPGLKNRSAYGLGCGIGGPILYPYVKWLLEDSLSRGISRLYFVARDGYILKELADVVIAQNGYPIETKYIYGSRRAWRIASGDELRELFEHSYWDKVTGMKDFAVLFDVSAEELTEYIPDRLRAEDVFWTPEVVKPLAEMLFATDSFVKLVTKRQQEKRRLLLRYMQQEIELSDEQFAFVDLAGTGYTQECLAKTLKSFYEGKITNYFYRMDGVLEGLCENRVFYPNYVQNYVLLEMLCRTPQGQTVGYQETSDGRIAPVFLNTDEAAIREHGVLEFIEGAKAFADCQEGTQKSGQEKVSAWLPMIQFYLDYIYCTPDEQVADYFGDMPDMLTGREETVRRYAPKLTDTDVINLFSIRGSKPIEYYYHGVDLAYSVKRCSPLQQEKIAEYEKVAATGYAEQNVAECSEGKSGTAKRSGTVGAEMQPERVTAISYDLVAPKIVLYGAGKKGRLFFEQITGVTKVQGRKYCSEVVLWVDKQYECYRQNSMKISAPEEIQGASYDQIVIAVARKEVADEIKEELYNMGVAKNKILWIRPV